ncbi:DUF2314 domain-containing protein [Massilia sp. CCM 8734]|nr:DUF2314 domain-containing protein [Massilia sp. CCM 8734]
MSTRLCRELKMQQQGSRWRARRNRARRLDDGSKAFQVAMIHQVREGILRAPRTRCGTFWNGATPMTVKPLTTGAPMPLIDTDLALIFVLALLLCLCLYMRWRYPVPAFPPMATQADDPLMQAAKEQAKAGLGRFRALLGHPYENALVKLRFVSSSQRVEYLWAEVLEVLGPDELGIRLVTPPVTHRGRLERIYRCRYEELVDWLVRDRAGGLHGGFTERAMFAVARRDGLQLPDSLLQREQAYVDNDSG